MNQRLLIESVSASRHEVPLTLLIPIIPIMIPLQLGTHDLYNASLLFGNFSFQSKSFLVIIHYHES